MQKDISDFLTRRDLRHAAEALAARAAYIKSRLSRDPVLRRAALREARRCERIAALLAGLLGSFG